MDMSAKENLSLYMMFGKVTDKGKIKGFRNFIGKSLESGELYNVYLKLVKGYEGVIVIPNIKDKEELREFFEEHEPKLICAKEYFRDKEYVAELIDSKFNEFGEDKDDVNLDYSIRSRGNGDKYIFIGNYDELEKDGSLTITDDMTDYIGVEDDGEITMSDKKKLFCEIWISNQDIEKYVGD